MRASIIILILLVLGTALRLEAQPLFITEFMAASHSIWVDEKGRYQDWVEIYNPGPEEVSLEGWYLTDQTSLAQWTAITNVTVPPNGFRVVDPGFGLGASGDYLALAHLQSGYLHVVGHFPSQVPDVAYGFPMLGNLVFTNLPTYLAPSPGRRNGEKPRTWPLVLTEIMYAPISIEPGFVPDERLQFVELKNVGQEPLDLGGFSLAKGIRFEFPSMVLPPGERVLVVSNRMAFEFRYGSGLPIAGEFSGNLRNTGERIVLRSPVGEPVVDMLYDQTWRPLADGLGFSLVLKDDSMAPARYDDPGVWRNSAQDGGSPGRAEPPDSPPPVVVNEILAAAEAPYEDVIELANLGSGAVDVSGWFLSDRRGTPRKFRIPEGTIIPGNGYQSFDEHAFNPFEERASPTTFSFSAFGEDVWLFSADLSGNLTGYAHGFAFGFSEPNVSLGRIASGTGEEHLVPQSAMTFQQSNAPPAFGPLVISEILYWVRPGAIGNVVEYIELHNRTGDPVPLYDPLFPTNRWKLAKALDFRFPEAVVPPFGYVVISSIDPESASLAYFRSSNFIPEDARVFGPWTRGLSSDGELIELLRPGSPAPDSGLVSYQLVDAVEYSPADPWPKAAAGFGASLNRVNDHPLGSDPTNWRAAMPNAGRPFVESNPTITSQPTNVSTTLGGSATFAISVAGGPPVAYQWSFNGRPVLNGSQPAFTVPASSNQHVGLYSCTVLSPTGSATSRNAMLSLGHFPLQDVTPPLVTIRSPQSSSLAVPGRSFTLDGEALDDVGLAAVVIQQNDGPLQPAWVTTNGTWTSTTFLNETRTLIRVMALDRAGNVSLTNTIEVHLIPGTPVGLAISGSGAVVGLTNGQVLTLGSPYSARAIPAPAQLFAGWRDGEGNLVSTSPVLSFIAEVDTRLTATFVDETHFLGMQGNYVGLFFDPVQPDHERAGSIKFTVRRTGRFTGTLRLGGRTRAFVGGLDADLDTRVVLAQGTGRETVLTFRLTRETDAVTGTVSNALVQTTVAGSRTMAPGKNAGVPWAGIYVLGFPETAGGVAAEEFSPLGLTIQPGGRSVLRGVMPGGHHVSHRGMMTTSGSLAVHERLHEGNGSLIGWLNVTPAPPAGAAGVLLWSRVAANPTEGFNYWLRLEGSRVPGPNITSAARGP